MRKTAKIKQTKKKKNGKRRKEKNLVCSYTDEKINKDV